MDSDKPRDHCGVFGIYDHENAANITQRALYSLQHRGEESAGIAAANKRAISLLKGKGLVEDVFKCEDAERLKGVSATGHIRYSLIGESNVANAQPFVTNKGYSPDQTVNGKAVRYGNTFFQKYEDSPFAVSHNGNFISGLESLCYNSSDTKSVADSDTKLFADMLSKYGKNLKTAVLDALQKVQGSYSLVILTPDMLIGARDPNGYRPLSLGFLDGKFVLSSESCAFEQIGAKFVRDINPAEVLFINKKGIHSEYLYTKELPKRRECIFEHIYLSRQDSIVFGESVHSFRLKAGRILARKKPAEADMVVGVPDAGSTYAKGFSEEAGIPFESEALKRNHYYPGRTFIQPKEESRLSGADIKFFAIPEVVKGKRIVVIDDSMVRGINMRTASRKLREAGAKEIHARIASPPYVSACYWGVDTYNTSKLIALNETMVQMTADLDVDSIEYLSLEDLLPAFESPENKCVHCFERH